MLLFLDQQHDAHADWVEAECDRRGVRYLRFCTETFPYATQLSVQIKNGEISGSIRTAQQEVLLEAITGVWYRRPGESTFHPELDATYEEFARVETQETLNGLYRALWDRRWVSRPHQIRAANHKIHQLRLARRLGFQTAPTLVSNDPDQVVEFFVNTCSGRMIYKTLRQVPIAYADGSAYGIYTTLITQDSLHQHLEAIRFIPCLFQPLVPKQYELRINVIGDQVWAAAIYTQEAEQTKVDFRPYTDECRRAPDVLPPALEEKCLAMNRHLGLRMSNIDMIVTPDGEYVFLEINANGQWAWIEDQVGFPLATALVDELLGVDTLADHPYRKERSLHFEPNTAIKARQTGAAQASEEKQTRLEVA